MAAVDLAGVHFIEPLGIAAGQKTPTFAAVEEGAVGSHRHDHVLGTEIEMFAHATADPLPPDVKPEVFERLLTPASELPFQAIGHAGQQPYGLPSRHFSFADERPMRAV